MPANCLVVISYYNAWPIKDLITLLEQLDTLPSGVEFDTVIVVNKGIEELILLPVKYQHINVLYRENIGYNISAWNYGWDCNREYEYYLFLQDECVVVKENWLKIFVDKSAKDDGLIGESIVYNLPLYVSNDSGFINNISILERKYLINKNISYKHLQTLIIFATKKTMESLNGFPCLGNAKSDGVAVEVSISRAVVSAGFFIKQLSFYPFEYIIHPQWSEERKKVRTVIGTLRRVFQVVRSNVKLPKL